MTETASPALGGGTERGGTRGRTRERNESRAAAEVESSGEVSDTAEMAAAKYAGGMSGRDSEHRIERIAEAAAQRWRC